MQERRDRLFSPAALLFNLTVKVLLTCRLFSAVFFPHDTVNVLSDLLHLFNLVFQHGIAVG